MNEEIRIEAMKHNVRLWELANRFGVSDSYFSRKLRKELSDEEKALALQYIGEIAAERSKS